MREEVALKINLPESRVQVSIKHTIRCSFSSSSGATTSLFESLGLLIYFPPFNSAMDAFCPVIYFHNSKIIFYIIHPSNIWSSC